MPISAPFTLRDLDTLAALRDELRVQAHLFKAELRDRWQEAERRWQDVQNEARVVRAVLGNSRAELGAAASLTAAALQEAYEDLRCALRQQA